MVEIYSFFSYRNSIPVIQLFQSYFYAVKTGKGSKKIAEILRNKYGVFILKWVIFSCREKFDQVDFDHVIASNHFWTMNRYMYHTINKQCCNLHFSSSFLQILLIYSICLKLACSKICHKKFSRWTACLGCCLWASEERKLLVYEGNIFIPDKSEEGFFLEPWWSSI